MNKTHANPRPRKYRRPRRRGAIIVLIAVLLPVLFVLIGFSIDVANMQRTRTELRTATDLAAKATARELAKAGNQTDAIALGQQIAAANMVAGDGLSLVASDFVFGSSQKSPSGKWIFTPAATPLNSVRITGARTASSTDGSVSLFFGSFYGQSDFQPQTTAAAAFRLVDICLVLDRSSSMKKDLSESGGLPSSDARWCKPPNGASRWRDLDAAVRVFLDTMDITPENESLAMVTFGGPLGVTEDCSGTADISVVTLDQALTTSTAAIGAALDARSAGVWNGMTDVKSGMQAGINELLNSRPGAERVMIVFTDGQYTEDNPIPMATTAANNDITVHTVTFGGNGTDPWIGDMQTVAADGGGTHIHAPTSQALKDAFEELAVSVTLLIE